MTGAASPPETVEFVAIVNSFNRRALLEKALGALIGGLQALPFGSAIVVYEAGSTDGSREFLERTVQENLQQRIDLIVPAAGDDTRFSAGVNAACRQALAMYPNLRWLMLYETDNWIAGPEPLLQARTLLNAEPRLAAAGFTVRLHSGKRCGYGMRFPSVISLAVGQIISARWNLDGPNPGPGRHSSGIEWFTCDAVFTSPLVIRREAWLESGGLDQQAFPFSDSDLDWAWRCSRLGWSMGVIETDAVVHDNLAVASAWSSHRVVDFHRSRLRLLKRHRGRWAGAIKPFLFTRHLGESLLLARAAGRDAAVAAKLEKRRQMLRSVWHDYEG